MSFVDLKYLTSDEAREIALDRGAVGLIPIGAFEQHGPHLPLATDSFMAEVLATNVAAKCKEPVVVTPVLMAGLSEHHTDFSGTVTLDSATLGGQLQAYINGLQRMGLTRVCLLSFHGGNFRFIAEYADGCRRSRPEIQVAAYDDFDRFLKVMFDAGVNAGLDLAPTDSHAGAIETSLVLHVLGKQRVRAFANITGYTLGEAGWMETIQKKGMRAVSSTGILGTPAGANPAAGKAILEALVEEVACWLKETFKLKTV